MRVVLISCYSQIESTGLRILSACLKRAGFATRMIFLPDIREMMVGSDYGGRRLGPGPLQQIVDLCVDSGLVGMGVMTTSFHLARQLTEALHASLDVPIVWGGVHPTVCPEECLQYADVVCVGEGERALVSLARHLAEGRDYRDIPNLAWASPDDGMVSNPLHPLEEDLDALPAPDYAYQDHYVLHEGEVVPFRRALMHYYLTDLGSWANGPVYGVLTARGCPYRCAYCVNSTMADLYPAWCHLRRRSINGVIAEIKEVRTQLPGIQAVAIRDDTFLASPRGYIAEFSQRYRAEIGLPFRVHTTAQTADPAKLQSLSAAGMRLVIMGIQSGAPRIQRLFEREASNEQMLEAADVIHSLRPSVPRPMYDIITDNPYESRDDQFETLRLVHSLPRPYRLSLFSLTFYPGTALHERARKDGLIEERDPDVYTRNFQEVKADYYNLTLFCHSLNLPDPILHLMSRRVVFDIMTWGPFDRCSGWFLKLLLSLRLHKNRRLYARRRKQWLAP